MCKCTLLYAKAHKVPLAQITAADSNFKSGATGWDSFDQTLATTTGAPPPKWLTRAANAC